MSDAPSSGNAPPEAGAMLHTLIRQGHSFSGRERNCLFLNMGRLGRYADVSSISGLDFPDDGRAVASVDWDHDGDLDLWVANRSGPQVRFLRNDAPHRHHYLSLRLVGTECNRDAIGARVELALAGADHRKLVRTVRAGDGFLAQSSKWLHFGLGEATAVEHVDVRWPGGEPERFDGMRADGRYRIVQGKGQAEAWPGIPRTLRLAPSELAAPASSEAMRIVSAARLPAPSLSYRTFDGRTLPVFEARPTSPRGAPRLVILWASWCPPCLIELREIAGSADELRAAGLDVLALSVDGLDGRPGATAADVAALVERLRFPFAAGMAREQTIEKLQMVSNTLFDLHRPLPLPASFLIDAGGELAVIYRGRVDIRQLEADAVRVGATPDLRRDESLPFPGRWLRAPGRMSPFSLAWELLEGGYDEEGVRYVETHRRLLASHIHFPRLAVLAGNARLRRGEAAGAVALYREALTLDSGYVDAQNNLAWILATHPDARLRNGEEAVRLAEAALRSTKGTNLSVWSTLAAACAEAGQHERAVAAARKALDLAERGGETKLIESLNRRLELYRSRQPYRSE